MASQIQTVLKPMGLTTHVTLITRLFGTGEKYFYSAKDLRLNITFQK